MNQKCTYEKVPKNLGRALPPPHLDKILKNSSCSRETVPYLCLAPGKMEKFHTQTFQATSNNHPCIRIAEEKGNGGTQVKNPCLKVHHVTVNFL